MWEIERYEELPNAHSVLLGFGEYTDVVERGKGTLIWHRRRGKPNLQEGGFD